MVQYIYQNLKWSFYYKEFSDNQINYACDFFDRNGNLKSCVNFVHENKIKKMYFKWCQLIHAIPKSWKKDIKIDQGNFRNLFSRGKMFISFLVL